MKKLTVKPNCSNGGRSAPLTSARPWTSWPSTRGCTQNRAYPFYGMKGDPYQVLKSVLRGQIAGEP